MSKLIPQVSDAEVEAEPLVESPAPLTPGEIQMIRAAPVTKTVTIPLDVANAIQREAARDPSDPFLARRIAAHYRSGIWTPADAKSK